MWVDDALKNDSGRITEWSRGLAVGSKEFVIQVKNEIGIAVKHRHTNETVIGYVLSEPLRDYEAIIR